MKNYILDAKNQVLGRLASEVAAILRGKKEVDFKPNLVPDLTVEIINIAQILITDKKLSAKKYKGYSGYPGGLKETSAAKEWKDKGPAYVFKKTILRMLPKNKLQKGMMKKLIIK